MDRLLAGEYFIQDRMMLQGIIETVEGNQIELQPALNEELDFFGAGANLTFEKPDMETFRCLGIAFEAIEAGGSYPVAMNGANEELVDLFLKGRISYIDIQRTLDRILQEHTPVYDLNLETILQIDRETRERVRGIFN